MDENYDNKTVFKQKIQEFISLKESIQKRIEEIESFYESNFDEPFVLNFEKGVINLKNILIQNKPNSIDNLDKFYYLIKNKSEKTNNHSIQKIGNKKESVKYTKLNNNKINIKESKVINKNSDYNINNSNGNKQKTQGNILNNNIFNNKLLFSFQQKEKDLKCYETYRELKNKKELNNYSYNKNMEQKSDLSENESKQEEEEEEEEENDELINVYSKKRNEYGELFNLNNLTSDKKVNTIKSDNDLSLWKDNESYYYKEQENKEEDNSINEELKEKFRLKEVIIKFILNNEEYSLLVQERKKNINPFKD